MDSKYNYIDQGSSTPRPFTGFNVKKKFSNGGSLHPNSGISPTKKLKKINENGIYYTKGLSGGSSSSVSNFVPPQLSIEDQRKQLPVYQVKTR